MGKHHCLALTAEGLVYGWGDNSNQEITMATAQTSVPTLIPELSRQGVKTLFCGSMAVSVRSRVCVYIFAVFSFYFTIRVLPFVKARD